MTRLAVVTDRDFEDIQAVITEETEAFIAADIVRWEKCWVQDDRTTETYATQDFGLKVLRGWDAVQSHMRDALERNVNCALYKFERSDLSITVRGDMAWVKFDEVSWHSDKIDCEESFETRILEREGAAWKIVLSTFASKRGSVAHPGRLAVDADRRVLWEEPGTSEKLKTHPGLTISNGHIRARRPDWDKHLGDALARAASVHSVFDFRSFSQETGRRFRCPVVFGEDDEGRVMACHVSVGDGVTYVDTDPGRQVEARLKMAAAVFGLSKGQIGLAQEIVAGNSLTASAETMGISINTARTHLSRIYDKTGVNSQTALVRLLLSVG